MSRRRSSPSENKPTAPFPEKQSRIFVDEWLEDVSPKRPSQLIDEPPASGSSPRILSLDDIRRQPRDTPPTLSPDSIIESSELPEVSEPDSMNDQMRREFLKVDYQITRKIGEGGMGSVYEAIYIGDENNAYGITPDSRVALKVLSDEYTDRDETRTRFLREATVSTKIDHPNVVKVYDIGELSRKLYYVMEFLNGMDVASYLEKKGDRGELMALDKALFIAKEVCSGLEVAHNKAIVHRDVKPENIFVVNEDGAERVKIIDLGIAKLMNHRSSHGMPRLTQTECAIGTPANMAPELIPDNHAPIQYDHRVDIYSLGVTLYEMVTGRLPFDAPTPTGLMYMHKSVEPKPPSTYVDGLPASVDELILKCLRKNPDDRYPSAKELSKAIDATKILTGPPVLVSMRPNSAHPTQQSIVVSKKKSPYLIPVLTVAVGALTAAAITLGMTNLKSDAPAPVQSAVSVQSIAPIESAKPQKPMDSIYDVRIDANITANIFVEEFSNGILVERNVGVTPFSDKAKGKKRFFLEKPGYSRIYVELDPNNPEIKVEMKKR